MKKKRGFTLVELLAVIVILAVILIIAMPKISDVIKNSKEASLETTAKLIASQAEKKYTENQVLDGSGTIKCSDVAKISDADYESCNITFDDKGNAKVTIVGKGKFEGMAVCNANKNSASISSDCSTDAKYFSYEEIEGGISITGYDITGGTDVVIPSQINGKTVVAIGDGAFTDKNTYEGLGITSVVIPSTVTSIGENSFQGNNLTNITIPSSVTSIGVQAFFRNQITSITFSGTETQISISKTSFMGNPIMSDGSYSFPSNVTVVDDIEI